MNNRLLATALAATAAMFLAATPAPAQVNAGINARAKVGTSVGRVHVGARQGATVGVRASVTPPGFHHGRKIGWRGLHHPPGWSHGRKVGWNHAKVGRHHA